MHAYCRPLTLTLKARWTSFADFCTDWLFPYCPTHFLTDFFTYNTQISTENIYRIFMKQTGYNFAHFCRVIVSLLLPWELWQPSHSARSSRCPLCRHSVSRLSKANNLYYFVYSTSISCSMTIAKKWTFYLYSNYCKIFQGTSAGNNYTE
jgi:hypothetical protein